MQLLERDSALAALQEYAGQARAGEGRLVLVHGEAGVGKSTVVEALAGRDMAAGWSWGACDGLFTPRPLGPLFDIAEGLGGPLLDLCQARAGRDELFQALLRQVDRPGKLQCVVLEDLHWADESTIDLLRFLGRRVRSAGVLVLATYRDDALTATHPLRLALGELSSHRSTRRIGLAPLSVEAVGVLAAGSGLDLPELYRLTGGNPFYVTEVLRAGTGDVPPSARDAVLARVAGLGDDARGVLDLAALTGTRVELALLRHVADPSSSTLDDVVGSGLLVGDGGWLRFRHEIARIAVEHEVADHRRGSIHARILAGLRAMGSDDDAGMAFHAEAAGDATAAFEHAVRAARRATELASHREAAAQYERALRTCGDAAATTLAELHDRLADEYATFDRFDAAAATNERALELWRAAGDRLREGDTMLRLAGNMWRLCRGPESEAFSAAAVQVLEPLGPSGELARAYLNAAVAVSKRGDQREAQAMARRAGELARSVGHIRTVCESLNNQAIYAAFLGEEWFPQMAEALDIALAHDQVSATARAFANIHINLVYDLRFDEAERYFAEGAAYCDDRDISVFGNCLRGGQAIRLRMTGRWDEAVAVCEELLDRVSSSLVNRMNPIMVLGLIRARRGDGGVWACLDEAALAAEGTGEEEYRVPAHLARAEAYWLAGDLAAARREVDVAVEAGGGATPLARGEVGVWLRRLGSGRTVDDSVAKAFRPHLEGDWIAAADAYTRADLPYEAALALIDAGQEATLRRALDILHELGATETARVARRRLRALGARTVPIGARAVTRAHPLGLTRREQEVLGLICAGHTNAEIAEALVISARTVDHHVSAVLGKLGAPSRGEAVTRARRLGLLESTGHASTATPAR